MATESDLINLKSREAALYRQINELSEIRDNAQELLEKDLRIIRLLDGKTAADGLTPAGAQQLATAKARVPELEQQISNAEAELGPLRSEVGDLSSQRVNLEKQLAAEKPQPAPPATAAQTVKDDAASGPTAAPEQTVGTNGRITTPENAGATNAAVTPTQENTEGTTSGTDAPTKTTEQTQAINTDSNSGNTLPAPPVAGDATAPGSPTTATPTVSPGVSAPSEDAADPANTQNAVNANETAGPNVKPRPNVLDDYASYTYSASVYLMTESQYVRLLNSSSKKIDGYQLLFQSGGAANNVGGVRTPPTQGLSSGGGRGVDGQDGDGTSAAAQPDGGRNPYFDNDFYIDSVTIENLPPGKSTGSAHNISTMKFTLVEPNGITLLDRLYDAVANSAPQSADGKVNYAAATYLMVIRFYGYDSEGNLEQIRSKPDQEGTSDPAALVEKFIPFRVAGIKWSVGSKLVSYDWECVPIGQMIAGYASRGTIPYDVQLVDSTVGGLLGSAAKYTGTTASAAAPGASTTTAADPNQSDAETRRLASAGSAASAPASAPAKANAAPTDKTTVTAGLVGAMNDFQKKLVKDGIYTYADEYVVRFVGPDANKIKDAKLQLPNTKVDKRLTAAGKPSTQDAQTLDQSRTSVDMVSRSFSITAGQQLLQAIDLTIRNSSYIRDQALVIINPDGTQTANPNSRNKPLKWYTITMTSEPISELDPKRNDRAYRIIYSIASREVKNVNSKYFPVSRFTGVHKSYPYWFTGENTAVLEYQETMNHLYQLTISGSDKDASNASKIRDQYTSSMADIITYNYAPRSTESSAGGDGKVNEIGANAAEVLYSPGDLSECKVKIVGDPAWIMQGSNFRMVSDEMFGGAALSTGFMPDGSIAFDNQDALFEIRWQRPEDYDIDNGLADPYSQTQKKYNSRTALQSRVYLCKKVVSEFRHGKFEQTLEGALYQFPIPNKTNAANPPAAAKSTTPAAKSDPNQSAAETQRLANAGNPGIVRPSASASTSPNESAAETQRLANAGSASALGAQQNSAANKAPSVSTGGAGTTTGSGPGNTGVSGSGTSQLTPAGAAKPATDSSGTVVGTPTAVGTAPPKLAADTSPTSPTIAANQAVVTER